jgi:hypothetical protein
MITFLEVLDDAVKIGLGGGIAWLISRRSRSHEFEKERRRRKQDCLERVIEDLDEQQSAFDAWCIACRTNRTVVDKKDDPALEKKTLISVNEKHDVSKAAEIKFIRSRSKLIVFGFDQCAAALDAYHTQLLRFAVVVHALRAGEEKLETYHAGRADLKKYADRFRESVTKAFATL